RPPSVQEQARVDVGDHHAASLPDTVAQPSADRPAAATDLQAVPALADASRFEVHERAPVIETREILHTAPRLRRSVVDQVSLGRGRHVTPPHPVPGRAPGQSALIPRSWTIFEYRSLSRRTIRSNASGLPCATSSPLSARRARTVSSSSTAAISRLRWSTM